MAADPVETAEFINGLDETLPPRNGQRSNGDDHFRLIKGATKRTFPNITGAVTLTQAELNELPNRLASLEGQAVLIPAAGGNIDMAGRRVTNLAYPEGVIPSQAAPVRWVQDAIQSYINNVIYPVGSILINGSGANPGSYIGGTTWVSQGQGRVLVGVGTGTDSRSESRAFTLGETGGEYNHLLTRARLPNDALVDVGTSATGGAFGNGTRSIDKTWGGGQAHNNIPPYLAVHFWQRTA